MGFERWLYTVPLRIRSLFRRRLIEEELNEELRYHVERRIEQNLNQGMTRDEARRRALQAMGGIEQSKEECRDMRRVNLIDNAIQNIRYAVKMLRRSPGFVAVVILSLALGIGANAAVFTLGEAIFLRKLPIPNPHELVSLEMAGGVFSFPLYRELRERQQVFTDIYAVGDTISSRMTIPGSGGATELDNLGVFPVTANYFSVLGLQPSIGRFFNDEDEREMDSAETLGSVVVLSDAFWERQFGRDPGVLNRTILIGRSPCRIIGVAPRGFQSDAVGASPVGWVPVVAFYLAEDLVNRRGTVTLHVARLKPDVTGEQAQSAMTLLLRQDLAAQGVPQDRVERSRITLETAENGRDYLVRYIYEKPFKIVMVIVALVLLIACANIANLLLARAGARQGEIGVRMAIGCSRPRLVAQLLTESLLLALVGTVAGGSLGYWASAVVLRLIDIPLRLDLGPTATVMAYLVATGFITAVGFGLAPALRATSLQLVPALKGTRRQSGGVSRQRLSRGLVVLQVGLSLLLLVGSGLMIRSFRNLHNIEWGFKPDNVVVFDLAHNPQRRDAPALAQTGDQLWRRLKEVPGIDSVSLSGIMIFGRSDIGARISLHNAVGSTGEPTVARFNSVSPGYFETLGMQILEGRSLRETDGAGSPMVAVVNESLARFFAGGAVGKEMSSTNIRQAAPIQVVGVVRDAKYNNLRAETKPMFYMTITQLPRTLRSIEVRTHQTIAAVAPQIRQAALEVTKDIMIRRAVSLTEQVDQSLTAERMIMRLCSVFGGLALLLACVGLYGVVSFAVTQRTNEIGIRMTVGATRRAVLWMVLSETSRMVIVGLVLGLVFAFASTRLLTSFLYGLTPTDVTTITVAIILLIAAAAIAAYLPARRASRVDPMIALRYE